MMEKVSGDGALSGLAVAGLHALNFTEMMHLQK